MEPKPPPPGGMTIEEARRITRWLADHYGQVTVTVVRNGVAEREVIVKARVVDKPKTNQVKDKE